MPEPTTTTTETAAPAAATATAQPAAAATNTGTSEAGQPSPAAPAAGADGTGEPAVGGATTGAPEAYADFNVPDGVEFDPVTLEESKALFKAQGLTQAQAQALIDYQAQRIQASEASFQSAFTKQIEAWQAEGRADKTIGGAEYDKSVATAKVAMQHFGDPVLHGLFESAGLIHHPAVIRAFSKIGALLREDVPPGGKPSVEQRPLHERLYPTTH